MQHYFKTDRIKKVKLLKDIFMFQQNIINQINNIDLRFTSSDLEEEQIDTIVEQHMFKDILLDDSVIRILNYDS